MGTNYYVKVPKSYEDIMEDISSYFYNDYLELNEIDIQELNEIDIQEFDSPRHLLDYLDGLCILLDIELDSEDHQKFFDIYKYVHICKFSAGWVPIFQNTEYFSTINDFHDFVSNSNYIIVNEYGERFSLREFYDLLDERFEMYDKIPYHDYSEGIYYWKNRAFS